MTRSLSYVGVGAKTDAAVAAKLVQVAYIAAELGLEPDDRELASKVRSLAAERVAQVFDGALPSEAWLGEAVRRHPLTVRNAFVDWRSEAAA